MRFACAFLLLLVTSTTTDAAPRDAIESVARGYLAGRPDLASGDLVLESTRPWGLARFRRQHKGVPVLGGSVAVRIDDNGQLRYASADRGVVPAELSVDPRLSASEAVFVASEGRFADPRSARLRILARPQRRARLVWDVELPVDWVKLTHWRVYVDAQDGRPLYRENLLLTVGRAKAFTGGSPKHGALEEVTLPLTPGAQHLVNLDFEAHNCVDKGTCPLTYEHEPLRFCEVDPKATADASGDFLYNRPASDTEPEDEFSEVQIFYHANKALAEFHELGLENFATRPMEVYANHRRPRATGCSTAVTLDPYDNAFFTGGGHGGAFAGFPRTPSLVFGQGVKIDYAYDGDVVYHELGHAMQSVLYFDGFSSIYTDELGLNIDGFSMNEATADYFSVVVSGDPLMGEYSLDDEARDLSIKQKCPDNIAGEGHFDSTMFSSGLWTARTALAEAMRPTFDKAVFRGLAAYGDTESFDGAQGKIVNELRALAGDAAAQTVSAKFAEHGLNGCKKRVADLIPGQAWPLLFMLGTFGEKQIPAPVQWRLTLDKPADQLVITIGDVGNAQQRGTMKLVMKKGTEPIKWDADAVTHDGTEAVVQVSTEGLNATRIVGPFAAGPIVVQLMQVGATTQEVSLQDIQFRGENVTPSIDAGTGGGGGDGGGCQVGGRGSRAAWLLVLAALAVFTSRRASRRGRGSRSCP